ncbi:diacylglycerol/lipid kinase family protein [Leeuwenhoekiella sp. MAR_2009_132]|uniref:diacylglycerol/lipid kinase family protein n=1 Tax=Leeuwenhoekiella sp. MAR_2009_132 TaxID=1392489 RepID=UPI00048E3C34|nr:YegS/Rv2252/BmrU family lipid kinase [Leeuwenhoekiella sp. MAR_2009_132]
MKAQKTILLVINPIAGGTDKKPIIEAFKNHVNDNGNTPVVYETTGDDDNEAINRLIELHQIDRVIISGGDGTIREVAEILKTKDLKIGLLPSGSANGLASNFNIPEKLQDQLRIALGNTYINLDIIEIDKITCLHIADLGVNAKLIENYEKSEIRGKLGYFLQAIPTLLNSDYPFDVEIYANGKHYKEQGVLVAIANANKFGTGANINPKGKMDDGIFEVLIFKNLSVKGIIETFYDDAALNPDFVTVISCKEAEITCKKPIAFQIDGEFIGEKTSVKAVMTPHHLCIAIP